MKSFYSSLLLATFLNAFGLSTIALQDKAKFSEYLKFDNVTNNNKSDFQLEPEHNISPEESLYDKKSGACLRNKTRKEAQNHPPNASAETNFFPLNAEILNNVNNIIKNCAEGVFYSSKLQETFEKEEEGKTCLTKKLMENKTVKQLCIEIREPNKLIKISQYINCDPYVSFYSKDEQISAIKLGVIKAVEIDNFQGECEEDASECEIWNNRKLHQAKLLKIDNLRSDYDYIISRKCTFDSVYVYPAGNSKHYEKKEGSDDISISLETIISGEVLATFMSTVNNFFNKSRMTSNNEIEPPSCFQMDLRIYWCSMSWNSVDLAVEKKLFDYLLKASLATLNQINNYYRYTQKLKQNSSPVIELILFIAQFDFFFPSVQFGRSLTQALCVLSSQMVDSIKYQRTLLNAGSLLYFESLKQKGEKPITKFWHEISKNYLLSKIKTSGFSTASGTLPLFYYSGAGSNAKLYINSIDAKTNVALDWLVFTVGGITVKAMVELDEIEKTEEKLFTFTYLLKQEGSSDGVLVYLHMDLYSVKRNAFVGYIKKIKYEIDKKSLPTGVTIDCKPFEGEFPEKSTFKGALYCSRSKTVYIRQNGSSPQHKDPVPKVDDNNSEQQSLKYILMILVPILILMIILGMVLVICCIMKIRKNRKQLLKITPQLNPELKSFTHSSHSTFPFGSKTENQETQYQGDPPYPVLTVEKKVITNVDVLAEFISILNDQGLVEEPEYLDSIRNFIENKIGTDKLFKIVNDPGNWNPSGGRLLKIKKRISYWTFDDISDDLEREFEVSETWKASTCSSNNMKEEEKYVVKFLKAFEIDPTTTFFIDLINNKPQHIKKFIGFAYVVWGSEVRLGVVETFSQISLEDYMKKYIIKLPSICCEEVFHIAKSLIKGFIYMEKMSYLHLKLTPSNLFIDLNSKEVLIGDLGYFIELINIKEEQYAPEEHEIPETSLKTIPNYPIKFQEMQEQDSKAESSNKISLESDKKLNVPEVEVNVHSHSNLHIHHHHGSHHHNVKHISHTTNQSSTENHGKEDSEFLLEYIYERHPYISPELFLSSKNKNIIEVNTKTNIWSLGALLYYIFYREVPTLVNWLDNKDWKNDDEIISLEGIPIKKVEKVPAGVTDIILSCLQILILKRPTAESLLTRLTGFCEQERKRLELQERTEQESPMIISRSMTDSRLQNFFQSSKYFRENAEETSKE